MLVSSESVFSAYAIHYFQSNKPYRLNRLSQNFWPACCIHVENMDWSGDNYKEDYHISSVKYMIGNLAFLWVSENGVYEPGLRCRCVFHISAGLFRRQGMDGRWGRGCRSYLMTYELVQTQVDIDMPQMPVKQSNGTVEFYHQDLVLIVMNLTFSHYGFF